MQAGACTHHSSPSPNTHTTVTGLGWGVFGSGLASTVSNWVSCAVLVGLLVRKGSLVPKHLLEVGWGVYSPSAQAWLP